MKVYEKERILSGGKGLAVHRHKQTNTEPAHLHEFIEIVYIFGGSFAQNKPFESRLAALFFLDE